MALKDLQHLSFGALLRGRGRGIYMHYTYQIKYNMLRFFHLCPYLLLTVLAGLPLQMNSDMEHMEPFCQP